MARIIQTADLTPTTKLSTNDKNWAYNGLDCCVTLEIIQQLKPQLDEQTSKTYDFSRALQGPVLEMMMCGLLVDKQRRASVLKGYMVRLNMVAGQLDEIVREGIGVDLNWRSPKQLCNLFYDVLGLPVQKKRNAEGNMVPTVDRSALEKLSLYFLGEPLCTRLMFLRDVEKKRQLLETGIDNDGRFRTNLNIAGTNTGRLASAESDFESGGNLQNVDRELRSVFIADKGRKFGNLDLEQADSRNFGGLCWNTLYDEYGAEFAGAYLDACESLDLHSYVARLTWPDYNWGDDPSKWKAIADDPLKPYYRTFTYRDMCKRLGHATNFLGQQGLAVKLRIPMNLINDFRGRYFGAFPCIPEIHEVLINEFKNKHTHTSLFGRRRQFWGRGEDKASQREFVAYDPQSSTAEEINTGLLNVFRRRAEKTFSKHVQLLLQVHDSLLIQYPEEVEDEVIPWAKEQLRILLPLYKGREFFVPVEAKVGWNWADVIFNKDGSVKENPDGLVKFKGHDDRTRIEKKLDVRNLL